MIQQYGRKKNPPKNQPKQKNKLIKYNWYDNIIQHIKKKTSTFEVKINQKSIGISIIVPSRPHQKLAKNCHGLQSQFRRTKKALDET